MLQPRLTPPHAPRGLPHPRVPPTSTALRHTRRQSYSIALQGFTPSIEPLGSSSSLERTCSQLQQSGAPAIQPMQAILQPGPRPSTSHPPSSGAQEAPRSRSPQLQQGSTVVAATQPPDAPGLSRRSLLIGGTVALETAGLLQLPSRSAAATAAPPLRTPSPSPGLGFEERVSEFTLSNGMHFIVLQRHQAPVLSCTVYANVGAFDEAEGSTGLAHLLEHMAFKGTSEIGSKDWRAEEPLLRSLDELFYEIRDVKDEVRRQGGDSSSSSSSNKLQQLNERFKQLQDQAVQLSVPNAFGSLLQQEGAVGLNASTSQDETKYFVSLPANKLELWFALEARRFQDPVFRELYSEKRVIEEERRLRLETSPMGKYQQQYIERAMGNNYRRPVIGYAEDVERMGRREVFSFFNQYYGPRNLTVAIVGDVLPDQVQRLAQTYFGAWDPAGSTGGQGGTGGYVQLPAGAQLQALAAKEPLPYPRGDGVPPPQGQGVGLYRAASEAGPFCMLGFYRPGLGTQDGITLKVLVDVLASGRTSRLLSKLVLGERSLLAASADLAFSGEKHAGLTLVYGRPVPGGTPESAEGLLRRELDALMASGPRDDELARVKKGSQAGLYSVLQSNRGMADALATYHVQTGSWRGIMQELEQVERVDARQCREMARRVFDAGNCFRGYMDQLA